MSRDTTERARKPVVYETRYCTNKKHQYTDHIAGNEFRLPYEYQSRENSKPEI